MELDDLKQHWKNEDATQTSHNLDIMEMIQHKSNGPIAALKRSYKRQIVVMSALPVFLIATNLPNIEAALSSILFWTYVAFCWAVAIFAGYHFRIVKELEASEAMVKPHLQKTIDVLEASMRRNVNGVRIALFVFIALTEILPYVQHFHMLDTWHSLSPFIRFGAYAFLVLLQYFTVRRMSYIKFGQHIERLKSLAMQME